LQEAYNKAKRYADFRKMLEQQKDIDGVVHRHTRPRTRSDCENRDGVGQTRLLRKNPSPTQFTRLACCVRLRNVRRS
jgi:hypothetical protein